MDTKIKSIINRLLKTLSLMTAWYPHPTKPNATKNRIQPDHQYLEKRMKTSISNKYKKIIKSECESAIHIHSCITHELCAKEKLHIH